MKKSLFFFFFFLCLTCFITCRFFRSDLMTHSFRRFLVPLVLCTLVAWSVAFLFSYSDVGEHVMSVCETVGFPSHPRPEEKKTKKHPHWKLEIRNPCHEKKKKKTQTQSEMWHLEDIFYSWVWENFRSDRAKNINVF